MNKLLITYALICFFTSALCAQDDDTIQFIQGLPVAAEETVQQVPQTDVAPYHNKQLLDQLIDKNGVRTVGALAI